MVAIHAYDWLYVVYSSDYSFLNIVSAKLLIMIYICWTWGKVGFCEMFLNGETLKEWKKFLQIKRMLFSL